MPSHPGLLLHTRANIAGKRERESEREGSGEEDPASCSVHKIQRQSAEVSISFMTLKCLTKVRVISSENTCNELK